ncbi:MAG: serine hydrolase [Deltaproteobacteria bacterium]|nr:serine hydrolase [Deltaproteobacteria bacterium]
MTDELALRRGPWLPSIHQALNQGVAGGAFPGGACAIYLRGEKLHLSAAGDAQLVPAPVAATTDTLYDLASLTKVLATTTLTAVLAGEGKLQLDELVRKQLPAFARGGKARITVRDLLAHRSGLPAWKPYFKLAQDDAGAAPLFAGSRSPNAVQRARTLVSTAALEELPEREPGQAAIYSDVGFIILGLLLEQAGGASLDALAHEKVFRPLGLKTLHFRPLDARKLPAFDAIAATGLRRPREPAAGQEGLFTPGEVGEARPGQVDDDNAFALGGVAGHAGLFGAAQDVARLGALILEELDGAGRLAPQAVWTELATRDGTTPGSTRALGFDTPSLEGSSAGSKLGRGPRGALGHTGFTGTSLWLDRDRQLAVALLTNRVHPDRSRTGIVAFRPRFHDAVADAVDALPPP